MNTAHAVFILIFSCFLSIANAQSMGDAPPDLPAQCKSLCQPAADAYHALAAANVLRVRRRAKTEFADFYGCTNIWREASIGYYSVAKQEKTEPGSTSKAIAYYEKTSSGDLPASEYRVRYPEWDAYEIARDKINLCVLKDLLGKVTGATSPAATQLSTNQSQQSSQQNQAALQQAQQAQQQNQAAQQQTQQAQQRVAQTQARADQARQGQRKTHDPAAEAHECIAIDNAGSGNFGAFKNTCSYRVNFYTCNYKPRVTQGGFNWSADFDCERQQHGMHTPGAGVSVAAHNRNTETVHWFACKAPATPADVTFVSGQGLSGRCY
jgi:hypothetical protein